MQEPVFVMPNIPYYRGIISIPNHTKTIIIPDYVKCIDCIDMLFEHPTLEHIEVSPDNQYYASVDDVLYTKDMTNLLYFTRNKKHLTIAPQTKQIPHEKSADMMLERIDVPEKNKYFKSVDGIVYTKDMTELVLCPVRNKPSRIPDSVRIIQSCAFRNCICLTELTLPPHVTQIGRYAFNGCINLEQIHLPETLTTIRENAFSQCTHLTELILPDKITKTPYNLVAGCTNLKHLHLPANLEMMETNTIDEECTSLTSLFLPANLKHIGSFLKSKSLQTSYVMTDIQIHPDNPYFFLKDGILYSKKTNTLIFCPRNKKGSVKIPDNITFIEEQAFENCTDITEIIYPDNTNLVLGHAAFRRCGVRKLIFPKKPADINTTAFSETKNIKEIIVADNIIQFPENMSPVYRIYLREIILWADTILTDSKQLHELPEELRYAIAASYYQQGNTEAETYIRKHILKIGKYAVRNKQQELLQSLTDGAFLNRSNTDKLIALAIERKRHEIYLMLLNYKNTRFKRFQAKLSYL